MNIRGFSMPINNKIIFGSIIAIIILFNVLFASVIRYNILKNDLIESSTYNNIKNEIHEENDHCDCLIGQNDIFCNLLMRIGILIEEIGKKVKPFGLVFSILELIIIPIVILWNMFCD
jgi:hypothetical protein